MQDIEIDDFLKKFSHIVQSQASLGASLFRGESKHYPTPLENGLSRQYPWPEDTEHWIKDDEVRKKGRRQTAAQWLENFKREAYPFLDKERTPENQLEWYILAQHYRFPTFLLDWTTNPLVALFFAVEKNDDEDGFLYVIDTNCIIDDLDDVDLTNVTLKSLEAQIDAQVRLDPCDQFQVTVPDYYGDALFIRPKYTDRRYLNQSTVLMLPSNANAPTDYLAPEILVIKKELKVKLRRYLRAIQITHSFIYPSLEGAARAAELSINEEARAVRLF